MKARLILWLAQGFGSGRVPVSPGTAGSAVGLLWFAVLLSAESPIIYCVGTLLGIVLSFFICGAGEKILKQKDPGSIVMDEIIAIPICFAGWLAVLFFRTRQWPMVEYFFSAPNWPTTLAVFVFFRIFDIAKPWPVRQSQSLPGGIGVTMDDVLAAVYVNGVILLVAWIKPHWF
jgi:phosphatidylglycerophosphatase A